ncbi:type II toxin-antitoxin system HicB family antitoxin [Methanosarcina sp.]|uniref:type II toxin-antitoxin system HicB family antitoxin n=1 Tax=Methanosarcina sp. TaxID=2213 RepID=UPI003C743B6E
MKTVYLAKVSDVCGYCTQGKTIEQAMERIREAIQVCLEAEELSDFFSFTSILSGSLFRIFAGRSAGGYRAAFLFPASSGKPHLSVEKAHEVG